MNKTRILSIIVLFSLLGGLIFGLTGIARADCTPDGTGAGETITCDTTTDMDGNGDDAFDNDGVEGKGGNDTITVEAGASTTEIYGNEDSPAGASADNDTIIVEDSGCGCGVDFISGDSGDGDNNSGNDTITVQEGGYVDTIVGDSAIGDTNSGEDTITIHGDADIVVGGVHSNVVESYGQGQRS